MSNIAKRPPKASECDCGAIVFPSHLEFSLNLGTGITHRHGDRCHLGAVYFVSGSRRPDATAKATTQEEP